MREYKGHTTKYTVLLARKVCRETTGVLLHGALIGNPRRFGGVSYHRSEILIKKHTLEVKSNQAITADTTFH
jgi:hypothetical protein